MGTVSPRPRKRLQTETVLPGQHQIEHQHVRPEARQSPLHVGSVRQGRDLEVVTTEVLLQQHPQLRVVIDHQNTASLRVLCAHG